MCIYICVSIALGFDEKWSDDSEIKYDMEIISAAKK